MYKSASKIIVQSDESKEHIEQIVMNKKIYIYGNIEPNSNIVIRDNYLGENLRIVYAGLLGHAQGILNVVKKMAEFKNIQFDIYGQGVEYEDICHL